MRSRSISASARAPGGAAPRTTVPGRLRRRSPPRPLHLPSSPGQTPETSAREPASAARRVGSVRWCARRRRAEEADMQRLAIAWLAASVGAVGCASTRPAAERAEAGPAEVNKQVARRFFAEILNEGRFEVAGEFYAPDFRNGKYTQQDDMEAARGWRQAVPDLRFDVELVVAEGDYVGLLEGRRNEHRHRKRAPGHGPEVPDPRGHHLEARRRPPEAGVDRHERGVGPQAARARVRAGDVLTVSARWRAPRRPASPRRGG